MSWPHVSGYDINLVILAAIFGELIQVWFLKDKLAL